MTEDEETPRIVAHCEGDQDEYGEATYAPAHIRLVRASSTALLPVGEGGPKGRMRVSG